MHTPRVAIIGVWLESNRQAPVAKEHDFRDFYQLEGDDILEAARARNPYILGETAAFVKTMDATGPWEPVPILIAACHPHGPIDGRLMDEYLARIRKGLVAAGRLDAVYVSNHGAMIATDRDDPDGEVVALARETAGADARIVMTLDLHGNISERMVEQSDLIVGYRTNPHVDYMERGEEAALALRLMLAGLADPKAAFIRLPLTPASVNLLTASGPYGEMIDLGTRRRAELAGDILNVSIFGGFVFSDSTKNGVAIVVTARNDVARARMLAKEIAEYGWSNRPRFRKKLMPLADAVALAQKRDRPPVIYSDSGDNPGGGGTGRTTELLSALVWSGAENVLIGSFFDQPLAAEAHKVGVGGRFRAEFNRHAGLPCDAPFEAEAEVIGLHHGTFVGRLGYAQGRTLKLGPSAALKIGGVTAIIISDRMQTADPMFFEVFGLDIGKAHTVAVKSRGHFRSGFSPWFPPERVYEVDTQGLTSPVLERIQFNHLPRPAYPLDEATHWTPPAW
ncbi:MAG: M81 family metallopeptidase [Hyphomicrobiaceae bacterium]|nr:M81 family metallopeptidase [Hyphomicrobiaceae bacterium]